MVIVWLIALLVMPACLPAQDWDADSGDPPATSSAQALPIPQLRIEPLRLLVFNECRSATFGDSRESGKVAVRILTDYPSIGFLSHATDSSLTLTLKTKFRGERDEPFFIPQSSFELRIILGEDTAVYWVDRTSPTLSVDCLSSSPLLLLDTVRNLAEATVPLQFLSDATQSDVRDYLDAIREQFADCIRLIQLAEGYYPCLPVPVVNRVTLGRRGKRLPINTTPAGYLVCIQVKDESTLSAVIDRVKTRQRDELLRKHSPND